MNRKFIIIFLIILVISGLLGVYVFFNRQSENIIPFSEIKIIEGVIEAVDSKEIVLKVKKIDFNPENMQEKETEELFSLVLHKKIRYYEYNEEIKSEEEFRKEENDYLDWYNRPSNEKSVFDFNFAPSWNKSVEISWQDLKKGDPLMVVYYGEKLSNITVMIQKIKNQVVGDSTVKDFEKEVSFSAEVLEILDGVIKVKLVTAIDQNYLEGAILELKIGEGAEIKNAIQKSEEVFRAEEEKYKKEREKVKNESGNILLLTPPSWYAEKIISLRELVKNNIVDIRANLIGESFDVKSIEQIIK